MSEPVCPNCGVTLDRAPQRKTKCKACKQSIFVKYTPDNRTKRLMTAEQAAHAEAQWEARGMDQRITEFCRMWGTDEHLFRIGVCESGGNLDSLMAVELRFLLATSSDLQQRAMAAWALARHEGRCGGEFIPILREHARLTLMRLPRGVIERVRIRAGNCARGQEISGRILSIDQALAEMPIPHPQCEVKARDGRPGYCGCSYDAVIESIEGER